MLKIRAENLAGILTVHTHPLSDNEVEFSGYDDTNDPDLWQNLYDLQPDGIFRSLAFGSREIMFFKDAPLGGP